MEKAIITPPNRARERPCRRQHFFASAALLLACGYTSAFTAFNFQLNTLVKVPINSPTNSRNIGIWQSNIMPSPLVYSLKESDRFVPIWPGNVDGLEVVLGDILLDKGIIRAAVNVPTRVLDAYRDGSQIWLLDFVWNCRLTLASRKLLVAIASRFIRYKLKNRACTTLAALSQSI
ncbi:hypothetical protein BDP27DRAFT_1453291 [Rhodocollybia butyracea]|uniref:Uncharacterized protein n=1 Tax=Rhodocollybia butyracea TaxID=206335 RepID=A0A9P5P8W0_9AGAR|nr:hypothetical protein BDP27DRAFT_1453289 [Rhodocollybia butyracea]KAF9059438.1 hypothetical protein BDP27DRAFT_1453291 [Rhodocollybia butyracea]